MSKRLQGDQSTGMEKESDAIPHSKAIKRSGLVLGALSVVGLALAVFAAFWGYINQTSVESSVALLILLPPAIVLSVLAIWRGYRGRYRFGFRLGVASFVLSFVVFFLLVTVIGSSIEYMFDNICTRWNEDGTTSACEHTDL